MASIWRDKEYQFQADDGTPLNAGKIYFYTTGTSTPKDTYSNEGLSVANTNPVVLDADGRSANNIWISGRYRVVVKTSAGVTIADIDPVEDSSPASGSQSGATTYGGNNSGTANALVFAFVPALTSYTNGQVLRGRILADNTDAVTANCGPGVKSLVKRDGKPLVKGDLQGPDVIEFVYDSTTDALRLLSPDGAWNNQPARVDVASAATLNLDTAGSHNVNITGTTGVTAITLADGKSRNCRADGALPITTGASLLISGVASGTTITLVAGDVFEAWGEPSGVVRLTGIILPGQVVGFAVATSAAGASTATQIPADDTIPQNTEGAEFLTVAYTPRYATSKLVLDFSAISVDASAATVITLAFFRDTTANAIAAIAKASGSNDGVTFRAVTDATAVTATTFKLRFGPGGAVTAHLNEIVGPASRYGAAGIAYFTVTEIRQ